MPLEDRNSQLALDLRDTTADRRRFNPRRQRGSTNVECLGHIDERAEISEFHASARRASLMPKRSIDRSIPCGGCPCRKVLRSTWHDLMWSARQGGRDLFPALGGARMIAGSGTAEDRKRVVEREVG